MKSDIDIVGFTHTRFLVQDHVILARRQIIYLSTRRMIENRSMWLERTTLYGGEINIKVDVPWVCQPTWRQRRLSLGTVMSGQEQMDFFG